MPVPLSLIPSSIDHLDLPAEVAEGIAQVVEFCREQVASASSAEAFETVETGLRDAMNGLGCKLLGAYAEGRDDGANRIERDGQSWFRVPFETPAETDELFSSNARREAEARLGHLIELRGIGMLTGEVGSGKTTVCRYLTAQLHPGLYRVHYVSLTTGNVLDMYKSIAWEIGVTVERSRSSAHHAIRTEITRLANEAKQLPVLVVDEAHHLRNDVLEDLRLLTNFAMDSEQRLCLVLVGLTELRRRLSMAVHESLSQRLVVRHHLTGLDRDEVDAYILGFLRDLQRRFETAVLLVHHARKSGATRPGQALRGSSELHAWGDSNLYLRRRDRQTLMTVEHRAARGLEDIEIELMEDGEQPAFRLRQPPPAGAAPQPETPEGRVLKALAAARTPLSQRQIRERAATRHKTVGAILQKLVREGRIERNAEGGYSIVAAATDKAAPVDAANGSHPPQAPLFPVPAAHA